MPRINFTTIFLAIMLSGCDIGTQDAPAKETRKPSTTASLAAKDIEVLDDMIFTDGEPPTKVIRFQRGIYTAKTGDKSYIYYESTRPIEMCTFSPDGKLADSSCSDGGIMIAKDTPGKGPSYGYIIESDDTKRLVWNLNKEFLNMEGAQWRYTTPSANQSLE